MEVDDSTGLLSTATTICCPRRLLATAAGSSVVAVGSGVGADSCSSRRHGPPLLLHALVEEAAGPTEGLGRGVGGGWGAGLAAVSIWAAAAAAPPPCAGEERRGRRLGETGRGKKREEIEGDGEIGAACCVRER